MSTLDGTRCIPNVLLNNEGPMVQNCLSINVHVVNTDNIMLGTTSMFMDCLRKQSHQCAQYKLKKIKSDASITTVGLILTKPGWSFFSGYGQTDTVLESSYGNMSAHKKFQLKAQNKELAVDPHMPPRRTGMDKYSSFQWEKKLGHKMIKPHFVSREVIPTRKLEVSYRHEIKYEFISYRSLLPRLH